MIGIANIRPYVEKMAYLVSKVLDMDVLICDEQLRVMGDFSHNGIVCEEEEIELLQESSVISRAIIEKRIVVYINAKQESPGCIKCTQRDTCRTDTIIAYPLIREGVVFGGIGIYSQEERQKYKLVSEEKAMLEFLDIIGDFVILKINEEAESFLLLHLFLR